MSRALGCAAVLDANVLVPLHLRNLLLTVAEVGVYRPRWSDRLLAELRRTLVEKLAHATEAQIDHLITEMTRHFPDARITGFEALIATMDNAEADRHVLAAAVAVGAARIVTFNRSDFQSSLLIDHDLVVVSPDEFLTELIDAAPLAMLEALRIQADSYVQRPMAVSALLDRLAEPVPLLVAEIRRWLTPPTA
jgi:predicted nucleic acid-binding protein